VAEVARATGRLDVAEDSVQDACVVAVRQWTAGRVPRDPQAWLTGVARHKALDRLRRESRRPAKEATAREATGPVGGAAGPARSADEDLWLIYLCCHPALSPEARIALTLRAVGGLTTAEIAAAFLVPEATMAKRLTRAKNKIRDAGLALAMPQTDLLQTRTADVLRVVYLIFSEGHQASSGDDLLRPDLCVAGVNLARGLAARVPHDPEVLGLLALLLLTDARRAARTGESGPLGPGHDRQRREPPGRGAADGAAGPVPALGGDRRVSLDRRQRRRHRLAADLDPVRRAAEVRPEPGHRGQPGDRGRHGRGTRRGPDHPRRDPRPAPARGVAPDSCRPRRLAGPDGPRRGGGAGVPHRAGTGAAGGRAALHSAPPGHRDPD
jgi:RNA polymerase sigma factor (sigma-70 family)